MSIITVLLILLVIVVVYYVSKVERYSAKQVKDSPEHKKDPSIGDLSVAECSLHYKEPATEVKEHSSKESKIYSRSNVYGTLADLCDKFNNHDPEIIVKVVTERNVNIKPSGRDCTKLSTLDISYVLNIMESYYRGNLLVLSVTNLPNTTADAFVTPFVAVTNKNTLCAAINHTLGGLNKSMDVYYDIYREKSCTPYL